MKRLVLTGGLLLAFSLGCGNLTGGEAEPEVVAPTPTTTEPTTPAPTTPAPTGDTDAAAADASCCCEYREPGRGLVVAEVRRDGDEQLHVVGLRLRGRRQVRRGRTGPGARGGGDRPGAGPESEPAPDLHPDDASRPRRRRDPPLRRRQRHDDPAAIAAESLSAASRQPSAWEAER
jgi:hypothetical protein